MTKHSFKNRSVVRLKFWRKNLSQITAAIMLLSHYCLSLFSLLAASEASFHLFSFYLLFRLKNKPLSFQIKDEAKISRRHQRRRRLISIPPNIQRFSKSLSNFFLCLSCFFPLFHSFSRPLSDSLSLSHEHTRTLLLIFCFWNLNRE